MKVGAQWESHLQTVARPGVQQALVCREDHIGQGYMKLVSPFGYLGNKNLQKPDKTQ